MTIGMTIGGKMKKWYWYSTKRYDEYSGELVDILELTGESLKDLCKQISKFVKENKENFIYIDPEEIYYDGGSFGERIEIRPEGDDTTINNKLLQKEIDEIKKFILTLGLKVKRDEWFWDYVQFDPEWEGDEQYVDIELVFTQVIE